MRLCQPCLRKRVVTVATQVDHRVPKAKSGTDDDGNLQSICAPCHQAKTAEENGVKSRPSIGDDGWPVEG